MRAPRTTYRVQVRPGFGFAETAELADYLADLGVGHLYTAPLLQAAPGSVHGYDVVDHRHANDELGGEAGRRRLVAALHAAGLGVVVDIVPNHMGVAVPAANPAWWDVLRLGRGSTHAHWFDIDWVAGDGRVVLPVLGDEPDAIDDLRLTDGELRYHEHRFPVAPGTGHGDPAQVHDRQHYRLVSWRHADALNYRRFFAVSELAALRVEDRSVFAATHAEVLRWYAAGEVDGIRVDHPDGLRDPAGYLAALRAAAPDAWLVVEKILEPGERLPDWPVAGTTGYDALAEVGGLFVDHSGETRLAREATPAGPAGSASTDEAARSAYAELVHEAKRDVAGGMLAAELRRLVTLADEPDPRPATDALTELLACFGVYRSYLPVAADRLTEAATEAVRRRPDLADVFDRLLRRLGRPDDELAQRFQQTSGAVMAKAVEDTAFYRYTGFLAANEVGAGPPMATSVDAFHAACRYRQHHHPAGMTTLSTHDTKRSEDVRARLAVLTEIPDEWLAALRGWRSAAPLPDSAVEHLLWQTVVGAWPIEPDRLHAAVRKSAREARTATDWDDPDPAFERALSDVLDRVHTDPVLLRSVRAFVERVTPAGRDNALGQKLVQLTMPGVPDTYQGCELWDNSLVDPDNRRPVDFAARRALLARLDSGWLPPVDDTGAAKLLITSRALRLRRDRPDLFVDHRPVEVDGSAAAHAVAFDRGAAITLATRLPLGLRRRGGWGDTVLRLPAGHWTDACTAQTWSGAPPVADVLANYPAALLVRA